MEIHDPVLELRKYAAVLFGCHPREISIDLGHQMRLLRTSPDTGNVEVLETFNPFVPSRESSSLECVAAGLARRAELDVHARRNEVLKLEEALRRANVTLKDARERHAKILALTGTPPPKEPDGSP